MTSSEFTFEPVLNFSFSDWLHCTVQQSEVEDRDIVIYNKKYVFCLHPISGTEFL